MLVKALKAGAPGESRTPDLLVRSQLLYPAELRARILSEQLCHAGIFLSMEIQRLHRSLCMKNLSIYSGVVVSISGIPHKRIIPKQPEDAGLWRSIFCRMNFLE